MLACETLRKAGYTVAALSTVGGTRAERFYRANGWTAIGKNRKGAFVVVKTDASAWFLQTQFCMDLAIVRRWTQRLDELGLLGRLKVLIGIAPLASARWMRGRLYGTIIPTR